MPIAKYEHALTGIHAPRPALPPASSSAARARRRLRSFGAVFEAEYSCPRIAIDEYRAYARDTPRICLGQEDRTDPTQLLTLDLSACNERCGVPLPRLDHSA